MHKGALLVLALSTILLAGPICSAEDGLKKNESIVKVGDIDKAPYLRLDFNLKGATCVTCIRRVAKHLRQTKGVFKADISIIRPYEGVVVFDPQKTNVEKLSSEITKEEKRASAGDLQLTALTSVPSIVLPRVKTP
ncbi:MAG: heavy-metal-associated domain-containing protein [Cyanobacteria bacterium TGS_CYA1]|nr:heavy-metal-associated domain-containing protein [Cyanobacteria bacterium TGS_CYA1]